MTNKPVQLDAASVKRLSKEGKHADIEKYRLAGNLDDMLGIVRRYPPKSGQWSRADLDAMTAENRHDEIDAARAAGQLATLLGADL